MKTKNNLIKSKKSWKILYNVKWSKNQINKILRTFFKSHNKTKKFNKINQNLKAWIKESIWNNNLTIG